VCCCFSLARHHHYARSRLWNRDTLRSLLSEVRSRGLSVDKERESGTSEPLFALSYVKRKGNRKRGEAGPSCLGKLEDVDGLPVNG
jgi:hypothetical protein